MATITRARKQRGIRENILLSFALFAIIALGSVAATAGIFVGVVGGSTSAQTSQALEVEVRFNMQNKTADYAKILQAQFDKAAKDLNSVAEAVANVFAPNFEFGYRRAYYHAYNLTPGVYTFSGSKVTTYMTYPQNRPADVVYNPKIKLEASVNYSDFLLYKPTYDAMGGNEYNFTGIHGDYINRTNHLDPILRDILAANPAAAWIYTDYAIGIQRTFPWAGTDEEVFGYKADGSDRLDYKTWAWYKNAEVANGKVVWTNPEVDPYIGWFVSASRELFNGTTPIGCVGMDFRLDVLNETIGNIKMYNTGYGFLINKTGTVVSHPKVVFDPEEEDPIDISDPEPFITKALLAAMTSGPSGYAPVTKNGVAYYLSYAAVPLSDGTNYTLGILVPQAEVLAPVYVLQGKILVSLGIQLGIIFGVLAGVLALSLWAGLKTADTIVQPITKLTNLASNLATEDVKKTSIEALSPDFERDLVTKDDEIGALARSFKNLVKMVQDEGKAEMKGDGTRPPPAP